MIIIRSKIILPTILLICLVTYCNLSWIESVPLEGLNSLVNLNNNSHDGSRCRYLSCPKYNSTKINVHIIAHTHNDVGWLKTVDQYYYGSNKHFNMVGVSYILDSIIPELVMDKSKRFVYVEISFFSKWWAEQNDRIRSIVKQLVNEGRLEFINGGWCMNDEATTRYHSIIEQMTLGLKFLNKTFGECGHPKVGWQIDPFGHSNEQASLFAQFGFDGMYFTRINYFDKIMRTKFKSLDLIWHGDRALEDQSGSIYTNIFRDRYDSPDGFCFDVQCLDDPIIDNPKSYENNIKRKASEYIHYVREYAKAKLTNHVLIPFGGDFQFSAANENFKNMDRLMNYISKNAPDLNIFYSTPTCYQLATFNSGVEKKIKWPEKYDDFMPYESSPSLWWSGYFSSRPSVKLIERNTASLLQVARLAAIKSVHPIGNRKPDASNGIAKLIAQEDACLTPLWEVLGDLQHHDAITGTEKQHVSDDYVKRATSVSTTCAALMGTWRRHVIDTALNRTSSAYTKLNHLGSKFHIDALYLEDTQLCPLLNISQCSPIEAKVTSQSIITNLSRSVNVSIIDKEKLEKYLETKSVLVTVYNPLSVPILQHDISIPCNEPCEIDQVRVIVVNRNETLKIIKLPVPDGITRLPFRDSITKFDILFYVDLPALGYTTILIEDTNLEDPSDKPTQDGTTQPSIDEKSSREKRAAKPFNIQETDSNDSNRYEYFPLLANDEVEDDRHREKRDAGHEPERILIKFDMVKGIIVGLVRASDGTIVNFMQQFGFYLPTLEPAGGAYIFRVNTTEPQVFEKPVDHKIYRRKNSHYIEIHQKWNDWIWQVVRVDATKGYIEFDHVIGPVPFEGEVGREVVVQYKSDIDNGGFFLTDSNSRQLIVRKAHEVDEPEHLGGAFYPVTSTIALRNVDKSKKSADFFVIMTDRAQAGASLKQGEIDMLVHRRLLVDDQFGVGEPLNETGEYGIGLVSRSKHRLYLKFGKDLKNANYNNNDGRKPRAYARPSDYASVYELPKTPHENLTFAKTHSGRNDSYYRVERGHVHSTFIVHDPLLDEMRREETKFALQPVLTFDRLRADADEFFSMLSNVSLAEFEHSFLNASPPSNIHLLTFQPWHAGRPNTLLLRFENLDNPLTVHPMPDTSTYESVLKLYKSGGLNISDDKYCGPRSELDIEYLFHRIRIISLQEQTLGANVRLKDDKRLDWTKETAQDEPCDKSDKPTLVTLGPRQIRTFLAQFEYT